MKNKTEPGLRCWSFFEGRSSYRRSCHIQRKDNPFQFKLWMMKRLWSQYKIYEIAKNNFKRLLKEIPSQPCFKKPEKSTVSILGLRWLICSTYKHNWICLQTIPLLKEWNSNKVETPKGNSKNCYMNSLWITKSESFPLYYCKTDDFPSLK